MRINLALNPILNGLKNLPKEPRSEITGRESRGSIMYTNIFEHGSKYKGQNGLKKKVNGRSLLHISMVQRR